MAVRVETSEPKRLEWSEGGASRFAFWLSMVSGAPLMIWWLGWYPGLMSSDSIAQLTEVESGEITNTIPAVHTIAVASITAVWDSPAAVTLLQVVALTLVVATISSRLTRLGVPWPLTVLAAVGFTLLPSVGSAAIALEVGVARGLVALWLLAEMLEMVGRGYSYFDSMLRSVRLGVAIGLAWLLHHGGIIVVLVFASALLWRHRRRPQRLYRAALALVGTFVMVQGVIYAIVGVDRAVTPLGVAYAPEVAAVFHHAPQRLDEPDWVRMAEVADLAVWEGAYRCGHGDSLVTNPEFDATPIRSEPGEYRGLAVRAFFASPGTVMGHRLCAAGHFLVPGQPLGERFETYTYNVPLNDLGVARASKWEGGFNLTKAMLVRTDQRSRLWLFWRPAVLMWPALGALVVLAVRRRRRYMWPGLVVAAYLALGVLTTRLPAFREVFAVYAVAWFSLLLWWPALVRERRWSQDRYRSAS